MQRDYILKELQDLPGLIQVHGLIQVELYLYGPGQRVPALELAEEKYIDRDGFLVI